MYDFFFFNGSCEVIFKMTKFSYKISYNLIQYLFFIGNEFWQIHQISRVSSMLTKYLKLYIEYFEVKYTNSKDICGGKKKKTQLILYENAEGQEFCPK